MVSVFHVFNFLVLLYLSTYTDIGKTPNIATNVVIVPTATLTFHHETASYQKIVIYKQEGSESKR